MLKAPTLDTKRCTILKYLCLNTQSSYARKNSMYIYRFLLLILLSTNVLYGSNIARIAQCARELLQVTRLALIAPTPAPLIITQSMISSMKDANQRAAKLGTVIDTILTPHPAPQKYSEDATTLEISLHTKAYEEWFKQQTQILQDQKALAKFTTESYLSTINTLEKAAIAFTEDLVPNFRTWLRAYFKAPVGTQNYNLTQEQQLKIQSFQHTINTLAEKATALLHKRAAPKL
jgi:hypothetical protein